MKFKKRKTNIFLTIGLMLAVALIIVLNMRFALAADIGNLDDYAWMEGYGFVSMEGTGAGIDYGVTATEEGLSGYAWSEKLGWINFDDDGELYAVTNDARGNLCGYAWSEKVGYISFCDQSENQFYAVTIGSDGYFSGYAWSEKVGYINMNDIGDLYGVATSWAIPVLHVSPIIFKKGIIFNRDVILK